MSCRGYLRLALELGAHGLSPELPFMFIITSSNLKHKVQVQETVAFNLALFGIFSEESRTV